MAHTLPNHGALAAKEAHVILHCNFEELRALIAGAELVLESAEHGVVAAPPEALATLEMLLPELEGDLSVDTLAAQRRLRDAVVAVHDELHARLDETVLQSGPASEESVGTYFDYAYVGILLERLAAIGTEMEAMVELITGSPPTPVSAAAVNFPD